MEYSLHKELREKLFFTVADLSRLLNIREESARVLCVRYIKKGIFIRLKNNFYILDEKKDTYEREDFFKIANYLQVPSYISLMTALSFYEITTQVQKGYFENISLKRSKKITAGGLEFNYYKLNKKYYFGFEKKGDLFISSKEKAFVDAVYLYSFGKYKIDFDSIDIHKFNKKRIIEISERFPKKTKVMARNICKI